MECAASSNSILSQRSTTKKSPRVKEAYLTSLHWGGRSKARVTQIPRSGLVQRRLCWLLNYVVTGRIGRFDTVFRESEDNITWMAAGGCHCLSMIRGKEDPRSC